MKIFFLLPLLLLLSNAGFTQWTAKSFATYDLNAVTYITDSKLCAVGTDGIFMSTDTGNTWSAASVPGATDKIMHDLSLFTDVFFYNSNTGYAVGHFFTNQNDVVFKTTNGGNSWSLAYNGGNFAEYIQKTYFTSATTGFTVLNNGKVRKTTNGGTSWSTSSLSSYKDLYTIWFTSSSVGFIGGENLLAKTTNGGSSWSIIDTSMFITDINFFDANTGYAVGPDFFYKTTNGGANWSQVNFPNHYLFTVDFIDSTNLVIAGLGRMYKSNTAGAHWALQPSAQKMLSDVEFNNANDGFAVGSMGTAIVTHNGGDSIPMFDAGIVDVFRDYTTNCTGYQDLLIKIKNYGTEPLTSVQLNWSLDSVLQTSHTWTGNLAPGATSSFLFMDSAYVRLGQYHVMAWTSMPNGKNEGFHYNDTFDFNIQPTRLKGTFSVGDSTADFLYVYDAINAVSNGTCDDVVFQLKSKTYTWPLHLKDFNNNNDGYSITFESLTGDSTDVILPGITLDNCKNVIIRKLSVLSGNTMIKNGSDHIEIKNCYLIMSGASPNNVITIEGEHTDSNLVQNNHIEGGFVGVSLIGYSISNNSYANRIINNYIFEQGKFGIKNQVSAFTEIIGNTIKKWHPFAYVAIDIIYVQQPFTILNNNVFIRNGYLLNLSGNAINHSYYNNAVIANNVFMSYSEATTKGFGISMTSSSYIDFYFNTFAVNSKDKTSVGFEIGTSDHINFKNNILSAKNADKVFETGAFKDFNSCFSSIDHNAYYSRGGYMSNLVQHNSLAGWQGDINADVHSIFVNPEFEFDTIPFPSFHDQSYLINNKGIYVNAYPTDFYGANRDTLNPDIGAVEFEIPQIDVGVVAIQKTKYCIGQNDIFVKVKDFSPDSITSFTVNWSVNGVTQSPYSWTGKLYSRETSAFLQIGSYTFTQASYNLKLWTSSPNNTTDEVSNNDTLSITITTGGMSGVYTIGGSSPDFVKIADAIHALDSIGVCSDVIFNIRNGTYNEQLIFPKIEGAQESNQISFQGENQDSSLVIISANHASSNKYTLFIDGASYMNFKYISFRCQNPNYTSSELVKMGDSCSHLTFLNNNFESQYGKYVSSKNTFVSDILLKNNFFAKGIYGINIIGNNNYSKRIDIVQNVFDRLSGGAIYLEKTSNTRIDENVFNGDMCQSPIYCRFNVGEYSIQSNYIYGACYTAIKFYSHYNTKKTKGLIANNMISASQGEYCVLTAGYLDFVYNTVLFKSTNYSTNYALSILAEHNSVRNNIIINRAGGFVIKTDSTEHMDFDYNNLYTTGQKLIKSTPNVQVEFNGLNEWQIFTEQDYHSFSSDIPFISDSNVHLKASCFLKDAALPVVGTSTDFDKQARDNNPDIGADEINPAPKTLDMAVRNVVLPVKLCAGSHEVKVILRNEGIIDIQSCKIQWQVNGISQSMVTLSQSISSGISDTISLGTYDFSKPISYVLKIWTENPNNKNDLQPINDTFTTHKIIPILNGTYSIGSANADFISFADAIDYLSKSGVCGPVNFVVQTGNYAGSIEIRGIPGVSSVNTITFESLDTEADSVLMTCTQSSSIGYIIRFSDARHIIFKNIGFVDDDYYLFMGVIEIADNSQFIQIENCKFYGAACGGGYFCSRLIDVDDFIGNNIKIVNNEFYDGISGIYLAKNNRSKIDDNILIKNNRVFNSNTSAIELINLNSPEIIGNYVEENKNQNLIEYGIKLSGCDNNTIVEKNMVTYFTKSGLHLFDCHGGSESYIRIVNNMIGIGASAKGLYLDDVWHTNILNNNIGVSGTPVFIEDGYKLSFCNNNLLSSSGSNVLVSNDTTAIVSSDYNNFSTSGLIIKYGNASYSDLTSWTSVKSFDSNSLEVNPLYMSNTNLHVLNSALDGKGKSITSVIDDIDGDSRNSTSPDIGADERDFYATDAGVMEYFIANNICPGANTVEVKIKNFGMDTLTSLKVYLKVNDSIYQPMSWTGNIATGQMSNYLTFSNVYFDGKSGNELVFWSNLPNNKTDADPSNDSLFAKEKVITRLSGTYTIGGNSADFINIVAATDRLHEAGICGNVTFNIKDGQYFQQILLDNIDGLSATDSIIFQSESLDSSKVFISAYGGGSVNSTVSLMNISYVTFQHLTLQNPDTINTGYVIHLRMNTSHININNCFIDAYKQSSSIYGINVSEGDSISIQNNYIRFGKMGVGVRGSNSRIEVIGNQFINQTMRALHFYMCTHIFVSHNEIEANQPDASYEALFMSNCYGKIEISYNKVKSVLGNGFDLSSLNSNTTDVHNNAISVSNANGFNTYVSGLSISTCPNAKFYYNSVFVNDNYSSSSMALSLTSSTNVDLKNNIFAMTGLGYSMYYFASSVNHTSDYNNFYKKSGDLIKTYQSGIGYVYYSNLSAYKAALLLDANSISVDPKFVSQNDLHINTANVAMDDKGIPISGITTDFDLQARNPLNPDIGADEFGSVYVPSVDLGTNKTICGSDEIILDAGFGFDSYLWSDNSTGQKLKVNKSKFGLGSKIYWVKARYQGKYYYDSIVVSIYDNPNIELGNDTFFCAGSTFELDGGSGYAHYDWSTTEKTQLITITQTGTYSLTVTDSNGCQDIDLIYIAKHDPQVTISGKQYFCSSASVDLDAGAGFASYLWSTNESTQKISVGVAGLYSVGVTDNYGCKDSDQVNITEQQPALVDLGQDQTISDKESVELDAGSGFSSYTWNTNENTQKISVNGASIGIGVYEYWVHVIDLNSCENADTVSITIYEDIGIGENDLSAIFIYPNPTKDKVFIDGLMKGNVISLYDNLGKLIFSFNYENNNVIDLSDYEDGLYMLRIDGDQHSVIINLVKH